MYSFIPGEREIIFERSLYRRNLRHWLAEKYAVWPVTGGLLAEIWCPYHQEILEHILTNVERQHKLLTSHLLYSRMSIPPEHQDVITWPENEWKCFCALMCINDNILSCWEHQTNGLIKGLMELLWTIMLSVCGYRCAFWIKTILHILFCFAPTLTS